MDLLIEIVVWLMRSLFGDPEKPADPSKFPTQQQSQKRGTPRGPYVYGDEPVSTGKSLEQILEEVRREALQRRTGRAPEPEPVHVEPVAEEPRRRSLVEELEAKAAAEAQAAAAQQKQQAAEAAARRQGHTLEVEALPSELPSSTRRRVVEEAREVPAERAPRTVSSRQRERSPAPVEAIAERRSRVGRTVRDLSAEVAAPAAPQVGSSLHLLHAIRHAPPGEKARFARQALVIFEVFAPPRSRREHKVGARII